MAQIDSEGSNAAGQWLAPAEAVKALAVSERTLRRHVRSGRYQVHHSGRRVRVFIPDSDRMERVSGAQLGPEAERDTVAHALSQVVATLNEGLAQERARTEALEERLRQIGDVRLQLAIQVEQMRHDAEELRRGLAARVHGQKAQRRNQRPA